MIDQRSDAELAGAYLAGNRDALAAIYDRYADQLHDTAAAMLGDRDDAADVLHDVFLTAAERLGQLRDPSRLRPWLFAILRHDVYRRCRRRRRTVPADLAELELAAVPDAGAEGATVIAAELAAEVRAAARGLDARDQLVLELSARQGLRGQDLADALGVSADHAAVLVGRMRERVQRSLGALAVLRHGRRACPALDALAGSSSELDVQLRKRLARHVESCPACTETCRRMPVVAVAAAPALVAPMALRARVLDDAGVATDAGGHGDAGVRRRHRSPHRWHADGRGFPVARAGSRRAVALLVMSVAVALIVLAVVALTTRDPADEPPLPSTSGLPTSSTSSPGTSTSSSTSTTTTSTTTSTSTTTPTTTLLIGVIPRGDPTTTATLQQPPEPTRPPEVVGPVLTIGPVQHIPVGPTTTVFRIVRGPGFTLPTTTAVQPPS